MALIGLKWPAKVSIKGRGSTITNSFVQSIIPRIESTDEQLLAALNALGMSVENIECIYCGDKATDLDHLNPIVRNKLPTGYFTELANLVSACRTCNQSKGGSEWRFWIEGTAPNSPANRGVRDVAERAERIENFEHQFKATKLDFAAIVGEDIWNGYLNEKQEMELALGRAQEKVDLVRDKIRSQLNNE